MNKKAIYRHINGNLCQGTEDKREKARTVGWFGDGMNQNFCTKIVTVTGHFFLDIY
jgi:hypothetical protein